MSKKPFIASLTFIVLANLVGAQPFASRSGDILTLDNGVVQRIVQIGSDNHGIISKSYSLKGTQNEFLSTGTEDFYFEADGKSFTGLDNWKVVNVKIIDGENKGSGALVILEQPDSKLRISITYMLYPGLPLIRKKISFLNTGKQEIKLEALDIEVRKASWGELVMNSTGKELAERGFPVRLDKKYDGSVYEIVKKPKK